MKQWNPADIHLLHYASLHGYTGVELSRILHRTPNAIYLKASALGIPLPMTPEKARRTGNRFARAREVLCELRRETQ